MKPNTCLVIDTWEGQLEIDEAVLKTNGVAGIGIRLNDMNGGHHMDVGFAKQWAEAVNFVRFPYFVFNPWVSGQANYDWLNGHMPAEAKSVAIDIEVRYTGITASRYATEVSLFLQLCKARGWKTIIYTGQWFLEYLSSWPRVDYWWAQYPAPATYFGGVTSWDGLKIALDRLDKPFNASSIPGTLKMWQFSGDFLTLPGNTRKMDINLWYGSEAELAAYFANETTTPPASNDLWVVKDDLWGRTPVRIGLPATKRYWGGKGTVQLPDKWLDYAWKINQPIWQYQFETYGIMKPAIGWCNRGGRVVEQVTFAGNIVKGTAEGDKVFLQTFASDETPPAAIFPTENNLDTKIQMFTTQFPTYLDMTTNKRDPRTVLLTNPGERVYMYKDALAAIKMVRSSVRITGSPWLRVRAWPSTTAAIQRNLLWGTSVYVSHVTQIGVDYWGKVIGGWIGLKVGGYYNTSWRP